MKQFLLPEGSLENAMSWRYKQKVAYTTQLFY